MYTVPLEITKNEGGDSHLEMYWSSQYFKMMKGPPEERILDVCNSLSELAQFN